jgi:hypothetical protein
MSLVRHSKSINPMCLSFQAGGDAVPGFASVPFRRAMEPSPFASLRLSIGSKGRQYGEHPWVHKIFHRVFRGYSPGEGRVFREGCEITKVPISLLYGREPWEVLALGLQRSGRACDRCLWTTTVTITTERKVLIFMVKRLMRFYA